MPKQDMRKKKVETLPSQKQITSIIAMKMQHENIQTKVLPILNTKLFLAHINSTNPRKG